MYNHLKKQRHCIPQNHFTDFIPRLLASKIYTVTLLNSLLPNSLSYLGAYLFCAPFLFKVLISFLPTLTYSTVQSHS